MFTDHAQTLEKRVQDAHTRKAAIELEGRREELHKHGLLKAPQIAPDDERKREQREEARLGRELRPMRAQRLAPLQAVQRWAQEFRAWLGERFGHGQRVESHLGRAQAQAVEPTQHQHKTQQKPNSPDLAQRQKELLRRIQANAVQQSRSQSRGHGYGHSR